MRAAITQLRWRVEGLAQPAERITHTLDFTTGTAPMLPRETKTATEGRWDAMKWRPEQAAGLLGPITHGTGIHVQRPADLALG